MRPIETYFLLSQTNKTKSKEGRNFINDNNSNNGEMDVHTGCRK